MSERVVEVFELVLLIIFIIMILVVFVVCWLTVQAWIEKWMGIDPHTAASAVIGAMFIKTHRCHTFGEHAGREVILQVMGEVHGREGMEANRRV